MILHAAITQQIIVWRKGGCLPLLLQISSCWDVDISLTLFSTLLHLLIADLSFAISVFVVVVDDWCDCCHEGLRLPDVSNLDSRLRPSGTLCLEPPSSLRTSTSRKYLVGLLKITVREAQNGQLANLDGSGLPHRRRANGWMAGKRLWHA